MEFSKSDSKRLIDGNVKVKYSAVIKRISPYFLLFVLLGTTVFALVEKSRSRNEFLACVAQVIGMLAPKNSVIEKCGDDHCYYSCGLTRGCLLYKNNTADWGHSEVDKAIFLEEGNEECYNKIVCTRSTCRHGNVTIGNGCGYCTSRQWLRKLKCN